MSNTPTARTKKGAPGMLPAMVALIAVIVLIVGVGAYLVFGGESDSRAGTAGTGNGQASSSDNRAGPTAAAADGASGANAPSGAVTGGLSFLARRDGADRMALGSVDAPVVLINYSDWRCPFCAKFARDMEPTLIRDYVDTGKLRIEWRDMPIFGDQSMIGARAGRAAAEQGKFHEFHEVVMAAAPQNGHADLTETTLMAFAEQAGIPDLGAFREGMLSDRFDAAIKKDAEEGALYGVNSTPTFVVGATPVVGAQPLDVFTRTIDGQLPAEMRGAGETTGTTGAGE